MNETTVNPLIFTVVGRIKGMVFTDLTESDYDIAILLLSGRTVEHPDHKLKANPVLLARMLGQSNSMPDELKDEPQFEEIDGETDAARTKRLKEFNKQLDAWNAKRDEFRNDRAKSARKFLTQRISELVAAKEYARVTYEERCHKEFTVMENNRPRTVKPTHYLDDKDNPVAHTRTGNYIKENGFELLDENDIADAELMKVAETHGAEITADIALNHIDRVAARKAAAAERRAQLLNLRTPAAKPVKKEEPAAVEDAEPVLDNN